MNKAFDVLSAVVVVAAITVLVRPGSQGPDLVKAFTGGFSQILQTATSF